MSELYTKEEILQRVAGGLKWQFDGLYDFDRLVRDSLKGYPKEDIEWALDHLELSIIRTDEEDGDE